MRKVVRPTKKTKKSFTRTAKTVRVGTLPVMRTGRGGGCL